MFQKQIIAVFAKSVPKAFRGIILTLHFTGSRAGSKGGGAEARPLGPPSPAASGGEPLEEKCHKFILKMLFSGAPRAPQLETALIGRGANQQNKLSNV